MQTTGMLKTPRCYSGYVPDGPSLCPMGKKLDIDLNMAWFVYNVF